MSLSSAVGARAGGSKAIGGAAARPPAAAPPRAAPRGRRGVRGRFLLLEPLDVGQEVVRRLFVAGLGAQQLWPPPSRRCKICTRCAQVAMRYLSGRYSFGRRASQACYGEHGPGSSCLRPAATASLLRRCWMS